MSAEPDFRHPRVGDDADGAERREIAGVGAVGHHQRRQERRDRGGRRHGEGERRHQRDRRDRPGPAVEIAQAMKKTITRQQPRPSARERGQPRRESADRAVGLGQREQQRHPGEGHEQGGGEAGRAPLPAAVRANAPTAQASGMAARPTFNREAKLMTMAASSARSDASAGDMETHYGAVRESPMTDTELRIANLTNPEPGTAGTSTVANFATVSIVV